MYYYMEVSRCTLSVMTHNFHHSEQLGAYNGERIKLLTRNLHRERPSAHEPALQ